MQTGLRERLTTAISAGLGSIEPSTLRRLAKRARVSYTTLARFVRYDAGKSRSGRPRQVSGKLRRATLEALAVQLEVTADWLETGAGSRQLGLWPILVANEAETKPADPIVELRSVAEQLDHLPEDVRVKAARAAVAAILEVTVDCNCSVGAPAYRSLIRLDALRGRKSG